MNDLCQEYQQLYGLAQKEHDLEVARWALGAVENKLKESHPNPINWESKLSDDLKPYKWPDAVDYTVYDRDMLVAADQMALHRLNPADPDAEVLKNLEKKGHFYPAPLASRFPQPNLLFDQAGHLFNEETDLSGYTNDIRDYVLSSQNDLKPLRLNEVAILKEASPWLIGDSRQIQSKSSFNAQQEDLDFAASQLENNINL